jgi:hypothetical protein
MTLANYGEPTEEELANLTEAEREAIDPDGSLAKAEAKADVEALKEVAGEDPECKSDMGADLSEEQTVQNWREDVQHFFDHIRKRENIDYTKPLLNAAFDTALKTLARDEANAQRSAQWLLREAHNKVTAECGLAPGEADDAGDLPNAGHDDAAGGNSEFSALDELEGLELEDALARMPAAKQDRYLGR